jgi:hypothetical protein
MAMANENEPPLRARRWVSPPDSGRLSSPYRSYRFAFRLMGIPILAVAVVLLFRGLRDRFELPQCDSDRAKQSFAEILKQLKLEPVRYEPIKTVSSSKDEVVCSALLPLPDGANVAVDFTFYWDGNKANMRYSVARKAS